MDGDVEQDAVDPEALVAEGLLNAVIDDMVLEGTIDIHWRIRTRNLTAEELDELTSTAATGEDDVVAPPSPSPISVLKASQCTAICPLCRESVGASRFAPHLERCMRGGKRGGVGSKRTLHCSIQELGLPYYTVRPKPVDPYPKSMIIKVKLRNGGKNTCLYIF
jgi:Sgf11 (transcriptional regulation protein)